MIVADSDVLIDALRGREPALGRVKQGLTEGALVTTSITAFELLSGADSDSVRRKVEGLLAPLAILPLDEAAGREAARIRRDLEADGTPIGMADYLIAGICLARQARLLTRNTAHFTRVQGLELLDLA